ncbi:TrmH family RNA methyltransferase [Nafulsella turpanensis]|uniref:TrmH family RNA methyltransferase n=1 Tax=Nafulsella turpanensis TaxID=1265690 RepID=UPI00034869D8|nr:RNA methyltransferase [Nafulsella turpanensis]
MITKKQSQLIKSLHLKKYRKKEQLFFVEGTKSVLELLESDYETRTVYATPLFLQDNAKELEKANVELVSVPADILAGLGTFKTNDSALAVAEMKPNQPLEATAGEYALLLDDVNDPGNLGTIIRIADWYGIKKLICSENTVDFYSPKVVAAAKGSFTRVRAYYTNLPGFLAGNRLPVYGADLEGADVHHFSFSGGGYLLMGNEANGIHPDLYPFISKKIRIPAYGGAESLNVAIATAIICDNLRRGEEYSA